MSTASKDVNELDIVPCYNKSFDALSESNPVMMNTPETTINFEDLDFLELPELSWTDGTRTELTIPNGHLTQLVPDLDIAIGEHLGTEKTVCFFGDSSPSTSSETSVETEDIVKSKKRPLQYPPCFVCGAKASGDHYGVNSCEACKGFFRRYLLRKKGAYECKNVGKCEISHKKGGMCSGCRLQKCFELGMSKDKSKLGRYSAAKRTEKIRMVKEINEGIDMSETDLCTLDNQISTPLDTDIISQTLAKLNLNDKVVVKFSDDAISILLEAKRALRPFGDQIDPSNREAVSQRIRAHHDEMLVRAQLYGDLGPVAKEEFLRLYTTYGIDIDNRLNELKLWTMDIGDEVNEMCSFAKRIPFFSRLTTRDQAKLLKVGVIDFYTTLCVHGYDHASQIYLDRNRANHISEMYKLFSREFVTENVECTMKCQKLNLDETEQALVLALSLLFTDRCSLDNPAMVEKMQLSVLRLLKAYLDKLCPKSARTRLTKIIEYLTYLRNFQTMAWKEMKDFCNDEVYSKWFPYMQDFLVKD